MPSYPLYTLLPALAFYELTTQIPHAVHIALERRTETPRLDHPPLRMFWFSGPAWSEGTETHTLDKVPVRLYNPAKSVADAFKYRNKIGLDVALEALKLYRRHSAFGVGRLLHYARVCQLENAMVLSDYPAKPELTSITSSSSCRRRG